MKPLNAFVNTQYSQAISHEYGDRLQGIDHRIFSQMLRSLVWYETPQGKTAFLVRVRDRPKALRPVKDLAQLGIDMNANDRFLDLLLEYDLRG